MDFTDHCSTGIALDAHKRVLFSHGLVLGESEFRTEQNFFLEKHWRHNRALHGYGTVAGLNVTWRATSSGRPELRVSPGLAVDPHGREICVPEPQCALLDDWLLQARKTGGSPPVESSPPGHVKAYLTLCYRECETDKVPIPVGPCFSLDKSAVASRLRDTYELKLTESEPAQVEERAVRNLRALLSRVRVASEAGAVTTPDALVAEVRALLPESSPPALPASPPAELVLDPQFATSIVRTAMRVFVTEVRPNLVPEGGGCLDGPRDDACVLLAEVDFDVAFDVSGVPRVAGGVEVSQDDRPLLLHTQLFQQAFVASGAPSAPPLLHPVPLSLRPSMPAVPASGPGLETVAAGILRGDGTADGPVLNNLRVASVSSGEAVFTFAGYRPPDGSFQYIVNAYPVGAPATPGSTIPTARLLAFRPDGLALRVTRGDAAASAAAIRAIPFMIAVSRIA